MMAWNIIPCKEWGKTKKVREPYFIFFTKEVETFTPSKEYVVIDNNKLCPTILTHPSNIGALTNHFFALVGDTVKADIMMENGEPVSYRLKE